MVSDLRDDFEILKNRVCGHDLAYLDNAATTQMPRQVTDCMCAYYTHEHANVHRGIHHLSEQATLKVEQARSHVATFIGAAAHEEVVFTSGATEGLNMAAFGLAHLLSPGSAVVVSELEHHSNFVPWQRVCAETGAKFLIWRAHDGELALDELAVLLEHHEVRVVSITQVSNVCGTIVPIDEVARLAHRFGALVVVDGAQAILHEGIDVRQADVDLYAFSAHKMVGPTGTGVLYAKHDVLERLEPTRFGGGMVDLVADEVTTFGRLPLRLEGGAHPTSRASSVSMRR